MLLPIALQSYFCTCGIIDNPRVCKIKPHVVLYLSASPGLPAKRTVGMEEHFFTLRRKMDGGYHQSLLLLEDLVDQAPCKPFRVS